MNLCYVVYCTVGEGGFVCNLNTEGERNLTASFTGKALVLVQYKLSLPQMIAQIYIFYLLKFSLLQWYAIIGTIL